MKNLFFLPFLFVVLFSCGNEDEAQEVKGNEQVAESITRDVASEENITEKKQENNDIKTYSCSWYSKKYNEDNWHFVKIDTLNGTGSHKLCIDFKKGGDICSDKDKYIDMEFTSTPPFYRLSSERRTDILPTFYVIWQTYVTVNKDTGELTYRIVGNQFKDGTFTLMNHESTPPVLIHSCLAKEKRSS